MANGDTQSGGQKGTANPIGEAASDVGEALQVRWNAFGPNERLVIIGGLLVLGAWILGILLQKWVIDIAAIITAVAAIVVLVVVAIGAKAAGAFRKAIVRVGAGLVAAFAMADLGDLVGSFMTQNAFIALNVRWEGIDTILVAAVVIGAIILAFGAWRLTNGNLLTSLIDPVKIAGRSQGALLIGLGAAVAILGWTLGGAARVVPNLDLGNALFPTIALLAAVLALSVQWIAGGGAGTLKLPMGADLWLAALGIVAGVLVLVWLGGAAGSIFSNRTPILGTIGLVLFILGAVALAAGGVLGMMGRSAKPA